jgi:cell division protein FtsW (lipid II flippase)
MIDFDLLAEFSRQNCVAICSFLVPANLLATLQTLVYLFRNRPIAQIRLAAMLSVVFGLSLFLHVSTWLAIGVVTPVTFILFSLGSTCVAINLIAIGYTQRCQELFELVTVSLNAKRRLPTQR